MRDEDWKGLMHALSIYVQGIHFSKGTTQREQDAIADHMIGVAEVIHNYRQPQYVQAISNVNIRLRKELEQTNLQNERLQNALREIAAIPPTGDGALMKAQNIANEVVYIEKRNHEKEA